MRRLVPITVQTWIKSVKTQYGITKAELVITPRREGFELVSRVFLDGKRTTKADVFVETEAQVDRRRSLLRDEGYKLTTKQIKVPPEDAPRGIPEAEIAERQYREEIDNLLRPIQRKP